MSWIHEYSIPVTPDEFDFAKTVEAGQSFRWDRIGPETWIGADGENAYEVQDCGSSLQVRSNAPESAFRDLFRLDESLIEIGQAITARFPELAQTLEVARGLRLMHHACKRQVLFSFLCSSMNNIVRIKGMVRYLADLDLVPSQVSKEAPADKLHVSSFPSLERLAACSEWNLRENQFGYRAPFIPEVAAQILNKGGELFLENLNAKPYLEAHSELRELRGIGPKVADCILLLAYGKGEAFPIDTHVLQAVSRLHNPAWLKGGLTPKKYTEIGNFYRAKFGNLAGYAQHLLFFDNRNRSKQ